MYRLLPEQQETVARAREIASRVLAAHAAEVDAQARFPREAIDALAAAGFLGLTVPSRFGGMSHGLRVVAAVLDELAQEDASAAMVYMMHLAGIQCLLSGSDRFAPQLGEAAAGRHLSTLAFSEKGSRSQFWAPVSRAERGSAPGRQELSSEKSWVTSAGEADSIIANCGAAGGEGLSVFAIFRDDPGLSVSGTWNSLGMRGNLSAPMTFTRVPLDVSGRLLGEEGRGDAIMLGSALPVFQVCQGAIGVGLAEAACRATQRHLTTQGFQHTGGRLADLPNLRATLAEMRIETDKARAYLAAVLDRAEAEAADAMLHLLAVKASSAETAVRVSDLGMRACGGAAFSRHLGLERVFRDARAAIVMAPTTDHLRDFIGRSLVGLPLFD